MMAVFGTRPDAIKMAPVIRELRRFPDQVRLSIVSSGQHREMLRPVLEAFDIRPDLDLDIMVHGQTLAELLCRALTGLEKVVRDVGPDLVMAQGDTSTTFAAALAAFYGKAEFAHVEAGLRTGDKYQPFPEEINRRLTAAITDLHFAPTKLAEKNLLAEGVERDRIWITGNTGIDAVRICAERVQVPELPTRTLLVTAHRRENWGDGIRQIARALKLILQRFADTEAIVSMHSNPEVRAIWQEELGREPRVRLIDPPAYPEFVALMKASHLILTDSGGMQEEAPGLGKPVLVLRNTTERPEGVEAGVARLIGTDTERIVEETARLLTSEEAYREMAQSVNPYGDGRAAERIRTMVFRYYGLPSSAPEVEAWQ
ncbi:MAG: UDP-N-acetyl glucosamine 2-epimerase [Fimbriimonadales bacterium]